MPHNILAIMFKSQSVKTVKLFSWFKYNILCMYPIYVNISVKNLTSVYLSAYLHEILITDIKVKRCQPFYTFSRAKLAIKITSIIHHIHMDIPLSEIVFRNKNLLNDVCHNPRASIQQEIKKWLPCSVAIWHINQYNITNILRPWQKCYLFADNIFR